MSSVGNDRRGAEYATTTPMAKTSTPTQGAQSPSTCGESAKTSDAGTPAASMPATIPNASMASGMKQETSRLDPETICPAATSSTAVVSSAPGRKTTSDATIAGRPAAAKP